MLYVYVTQTEKLMQLKLLHVESCIHDKQNETTSTSITFRSTKVAKRKTESNIITLLIRKGRDKLVNVFDVTVFCC